MKASIPTKINVSKNPVSKSEKKVFIVNGMGGCGKDTFAEILKKHVTVYKYSSINAVKRIASECGWDGGKTEKDRKFLSDLKLLLTEYTNLPFMDVANKVSDFMDDRWYKIMLIDIREPNEIERAAKAFNAKTILIKNDRVPFIESNMADANVYNYTYDYVIENNGTLEEFEKNIIEFYNSL
jgi:dephospho-CoA kinase